MTYEAIVSRIARHLVENHQVPEEAAGKAAEKLVRDCNLTTILLKGANGKALGEAPRATWG